MIAGTDFFRFGIPSLDCLFSPTENEPHQFGIRLAGESPNQHSTTSLSLIGRSGTGKSLLGLHLASRYLADCWQAIPREKGNTLPMVFYVSTDFTHARAKKAWDSFGLDFPNFRKLPFDESNAFNSFQPEILKIELKDCPFGKGEIAKTFCENAESNEPTVNFLDLASSTAGNEWELILRLLALLPVMEIKHLLIIDAVEGLETLAGSLDPHGHEHSHRARIAQVLRTAGKKCHVAFVLEETHVGDIPAEEYVTDVVVRLWANEVDGYMRRSLEVAKSRGGSHVRGHHNYYIRDGKGISDKGKKHHHPDDPPNNREAFQAQDRKKIRARTLAYIYVVHSLHWLTRMHMLGKPVEHSLYPQGYAQLDTPKLPKTLPQNGLPRGEVTVLTGDEATRKARFGRAFLNGCFKNPFWVEEDIAQSKRLTQKEVEVGVYLTTHNLTRKDLINRLRWHWDTADDKGHIGLCKRQIPDPDRIVFRQLEAHDLNSSTLFNIIRRCVEEGIRRVVESNKDELEKAGGLNKSDIKKWRSRIESDEQKLLNGGWWGRVHHARFVRVVIDDWTTINNTYPQVARDSLFLPFLIRYLEEKGVTTLIIETASGRPDQVFSEETDHPHQLRSLIRNHLLTWHVRFFGENRVAIAAIPPLRDGLPSVVAELRAPPKKTLRKQEIDERLWADSHFELYAGLERGQPEPVHLEVHLFAAAEGFGDYKDMTNALLNRLYPPHAHAIGVINGHGPSEYAALREYTQLLGDVRVPHTAVIQVDEYWKPARWSIQRQKPEPPEPPDVEPYLEQHTTDSAGNPHLIHDPFLEFQPGEQDNKHKHGKRYHRYEFFSLEKDYGEKWQEHLSDLNLVPYLWDFGFLLLRQHAWDQAKAKCKDDSSLKLIRDVWNYCAPHNKGENSKDQTAPKKRIGWRKFLEACQKVANAQPSSQALPLLAFDMDLSSPQTFPCLVLEMWASEIKDKSLFSHQRPSEPNEEASLLRLLEKYPTEFFRVWLLLGEVIAPSQVLAENGYLKARPASSQAVAERHWYSTAAQVWKKVGDADVIVPARLPGNYSTRGDWFLTIGSDSRSESLGERAIDLLSRRKDNVLRMEFGIGLPVRDLVREVAEANVYENLRTALVKINDDGTREPLTYQELRDLSACDNKDKKNRLQWLWRSEIPHYHRLDDIWEGWMARFIKAAADWNQRLKARQVTGFRAYDDFLMKKGGNDEVRPLHQDSKKCCDECHKEFKNMVGMLKEVLLKSTQPH